MTTEILRALDAIRKRVDAATPGPWLFEYNNDVYSTGTDDDAFVEWFEGPFEIRDAKKDDVEFTGHSRTDLDVLERALRVVLDYSGPPKISESVGTMGVRMQRMKEEIAELLKNVK